MSEDRDVHQLLGGLKENMAASQRQTADLFILTRTIGNQVATMVAELKAHMDKEDNLEASHGKLTDRVTRLESDRNRAVGVLTVLTAAMGGAWGKITGMFS